MFLKTSALRDAFNRRSCCGCLAHVAGKELRILPSGWSGRHLQTDRTCGQNAVRCAYQRTSLSTHTHTLGQPLDAGTELIDQHGRRTPRNRSPTAKGDCTVRSEARGHQSSRKEFKCNQTPKPKNRSTRKSEKQRETTPRKGNAAGKKSATERMKSEPVHHSRGAVGRPRMQTATLWQSATVLVKAKPPRCSSPFGKIYRVRRSATADRSSGGERVCVCVPSRK